MDHIRMLGSVANVYTPKQFTSKMNLCVQKMILVGYENDSTNYRVYDPIRKRVNVMRNVTFHERARKIQTTDQEYDDEIVIFPKVKSDEESSREDETEPVNEREINEREVNEREINERKINEREDNDRLLWNRATIRRPTPYQANLVECKSPKTYEVTIQGDDAIQWKRTIENEFKALKVNNTRSIVPRTRNIKTIDSKWTFKIKEDPETNFQRYKARLFARGFDISASRKSVVCKLN